MTGSPFIRISNVTRRFGDVVAVDDLSLDIDKGELFCLLGASGCGKTTLLRMLAGFESVDSGSIEIDGIDMSRVPPATRPVNIMFQNYALFPHMTVDSNIAYGLKRAGLPRAEIESRQLHRHVTDPVRRAHEVLEQRLLIRDGLFHRSASPERREQHERVERRIGSARLDDSRHRAA